MEIRMQKLHELRKITNYAVGFTECKDALGKAGGDTEKAKDILVDCGYVERVKTPSYLYVPDDAPSMWAYILAKVNLYFRLGRDVYRKADYFGMPSAEWDEEKLNEMESCFHQFADQKGYRKDNPVENVSVEGFYAATRTLHFSVIEQAATFNRDDHTALDDMLFEHVVTKDTVRLYNKVGMIPSGAGV